MEDLVMADERAGRESHSETGRIVQAAGAVRASAWTGLETISRCFSKLVMTRGFEGGYLNV
jgi:hypothetical protein